MTDAAEIFSRDWLELREPVDHRSRAASLATQLRDAWRTHGWSRILDLGSGTGSNLRYLAPRLCGEQRWTLLDHDPALLARVGDVGSAIGSAIGSATSVTCVQGDLDDEGLRATAETHVVTCSALLDIVSERWLRQWVRTCARAGCGAYFALTYDGVIRWLDAGDPDDEMIRIAVNAHQRRDQGRRTALGPEAAVVAERLFRSEGYRTWRMPSAWHLTGADRELACALIDGWARAALELAAEEEEVHRIRSWADRRRETTRDPATRLTVGHDDVLALPSVPGPSVGSRDG